MRFTNVLLGAAAVLLCSAASPLDGSFRRLERGGLRAAQAPSGPVVVYYGASWCGPCRAFMPELARAYPALRARGLEVVFVGDESCEGALNYARQMRMPWLLLPCDPTRTARLRRLGREALPGLVLLDRNGHVTLSSWHRDGSSTPRAALAEIASDLHAAP